MYIFFKKVLYIFSPWSLYFSGILCYDNPVIEKKADKDAFLVPSSL